MSDDKEKQDLKDEELDEVSGGARRGEEMGRPGHGLPQGEHSEPDNLKGPIHPGF